MQLWEFEICACYVCMGGREDIFVSVGQRSNDNICRYIYMLCILFHQSRTKTVHHSLKLHISDGIAARLLQERSNFSSGNFLSQICKGMDENEFEFNFNSFTFGGKDGKH